MVWERVDEDPGFVLVSLGPLGRVGSWAVLPKLLAQTSYDHTFGADFACLVRTDQQATSRIEGWSPDSHLDVFSPSKTFWWWLRSSDFGTVATLIAWHESNRSSRIVCSTSPSFPATHEYRNLRKFTSPEIGTLFRGDITKQASPSTGTENQWSTAWTVILLPWFEVGIFFGLAPGETIGSESSCRNLSSRFNNSSCLPSRNLTKSSSSAEPLLTISVETGSERASWS
ncbi:unnamed protein product, partial [Nesidiocoris tenuis]